MFGLTRSSSSSGAPHRPPGRARSPRPRFSPCASPRITRFPPPADGPRRVPAVPVISAAAGAPRERQAQQLTNKRPGPAAPQPPGTAPPRPQPAPASPLKVVWLRRGRRNSRPLPPRRGRRKPATPLAVAPRSPGVEGGGAPQRGAAAAERACSRRWLLCRPGRDTPRWAPAGGSAASHRRGAGLARALGSQDRPPALPRGCGSVAGGGCGAGPRPACRVRPAPAAELRPCRARLGTECPPAGARSCSPPSPREFPPPAGVHTRHRLSTPRPAP